MISVTASGDFNNTEAFLKSISSGQLFKDLDRCGQRGVEALADATPVDSNLTASSWRYRVIRNRNKPGIEWYNTNGNVAILIQYGHGTGTGGYVNGRDYINPAMQPVFDQIVEEIWGLLRSRHT